MYLKSIATEKTLCHSRAFAFVLDAFAKLVTQGHAEQELPFANQSQVTYGLDEHENVIAASVHSFDAAKRVLWVQFSAVAEAHRKHGAYKELFDEVVKQAKRLGAAEIYSGVATENEAMHAVAKSLNRKPVVVRYRYTVPT